MARSYGNKASMISMDAVKRKMAAASGDTGVSGTGPFTRDPVIGQPVGPISKTGIQPVSGKPSAPSTPTKLGGKKVTSTSKASKIDLKNAAARRLAAFQTTRGKKSRGMRAI